MTVPRHCLDCNVRTRKPRLCTKRPGRYVGAQECTPTSENQQRHHQPDHCRVNGLVPAEGGTYHLQIMVQVRPARPLTSRAPNAMDSKDAFGSLPESGVRTRQLGSRHARGSVSVPARPQSWAGLPHMTTRCTEGPRAAWKQCSHRQAPPNASVQESLQSR